MARRFELHLEGMDTPDGLIDAGLLVDIVKSLQKMTNLLGRQQTDSAGTGRPSRNLSRVARLHIGLEKGSTAVVAERGSSLGRLDLELEDEVAMDRRFGELLEGVVEDTRPDWVDNALAAATGELAVAVKGTAPIVELRIDGARRGRAKTASINDETWAVDHPGREDHEISFTGRLFAINLRTHRLQVQDDVGNIVGLPEVHDDESLRHLVGEYVTASGRPEQDSQGNLALIHDATIAALDDSVSALRLPQVQTLDELLAGAPQFESLPPIDITEEEAEAFFEAIGL